MTFTLAARCPETGQFGIVISSSSPAVAARCAHARAGVGAVATQNVTDPALGPRLLDLLERGLGAQAALDAVTAHELSRLDEAFQEERWGVDEEAALRTAARAQEACMIGAWFAALRQI